MMLLRSALQPIAYTFSPDIITADLVAVTIYSLLQAVTPL